MKLNLELRGKKKDDCIKDKYSNSLFEILFYGAGDYGGHEGKNV